MGAKAGVSVEEYLHTSFPDLDREYRDGELVERSLPDYLHGKTQLLLAAFFAALRKRLALFPCTETRMKIRTGRYAIPDLAVFWPDEPSRVPETPPLVVIEILSLDDRLAEVRDKLEEYTAGRRACLASGSALAALVQLRDRAGRETKAEDFRTGRGTNGRGYFRIIASSPERNSSLGLKYQPACDTLVSNCRGDVRTLSDTR